MYEIVDTYNLYEKYTDQIIHTDTNKKRVELLCKTLKNGSGFNGNTPPFFSNNYTEKQGQYAPFILYQYYSL